MFILTFLSIPRFCVVILDGIDICFNDEQSEKALNPIAVTEEGIDICVNFEHQEKANSLI